MEDLRAIIDLDSTDILARHDLALCYLDKGWLKESWEEMKLPNAYAMIHVNQEEKKIVESSFAKLERDLDNGEDNDPSGACWLLLLLVVLVNLRKRYGVKGFGHSSLKILW